MPPEANNGPPTSHMVFQKYFNLGMVNAPSLVPIDSGDNLEFILTKGDVGKGL